MTKSCIVISSIVVEEVIVSGEGGAVVAMFFIDSLHQGIYSSLEGCCFFPGYVVGLMQYCILNPYCIYLLE
jgi:hypothetical protein